MKTFVSYTYEKEEINWLRLNFQYNDYAVNVDLKLPYTPIELASALRLLSDKIRMKATF